MKLSGNKPVNKKLIVIVAAAVLALLAGGVALAYTQKWWPFQPEESTIIDGVNYGPPTEQEIESSQDAKKDITDETDSTDTPDGELKTVGVNVSHSEVYEGELEVRAFVTGVIEGTGTCTATLSKTGSETVTASSKAFVDASTSQCQPIRIPLDEFDASGEWNLSVNYTSPTSSGTSEDIVVTIDN